MPRSSISRRRALTILAATAGSLVEFGSSRPRPSTHVWRGTALGADAQITLDGVNVAAARDAMEVVTAEIERLERALSLFRADSEIRRLNQFGYLDAPSGDLRRALALALEIAEMSRGLFDPTVQALWETHVDWFSADPDAGPPPDHVIAAARAKVDWRRIEASAGTIRLGDQQRITLNGLGQGYVTDRIADLLHARGFRHVLVDLGEQRAIGAREDGVPWVIAREHGDPIALAHGALATSEGRGCAFGAGGAVHHLFDPRTGRSATQWRRVIVHHELAAVADALSTALYAASLAEIGTMLRSFNETTVWVTDGEGREKRIPAPPRIA